MKKILLFLVPFLLIFSCTVTKRVHQKGYHVKWNKSIDKNSSDKSSESLKESDNLEAFEKEDIQSLSKNQKEKTIKNSSVDTEIEKQLSKNSNEPDKKDVLRSKKVAKDIDTIEEPHDSKNQIEEDELKHENPEKRRFPLAIFLIIILLLMIPFSIISFVLSLLIWSGVAALFGYTLIAEILGVFLAAVLIISLFYGLFYLFFLIFYSNDP